MWLFAMFDLPVRTREERKCYTEFRNELIRDGFTMVQFSVYARYCPGEQASEAHRRRIRRALPPEGHVRLLSVTDRQFGKMGVYRGGKCTSPEDTPTQLMLF